MGVEVLQTEGGAWINMRGAIWRVSNEQMRGATNEESRGAEIVNRFLSGMRADIQKARGNRKYVDVRVEGHPRFPEDLAVAGDEEFEDMPMPGNGSDSDVMIAESGT